MAYSSLCNAVLGTGCTRLMHYSNPEVSIAGVPAGVPEGTSIACIEDNTANPPCDADNRKRAGEGAARSTRHRRL